MCIVSLVLVLSLAPVVSGAEFKHDEREIRLIPMADWEYDETVNLGENEGLQLEQDAISSRMMETEGIYYGPYIESSLFKFDHQGGWLRFSGDFRWSHQDIINGVSDFWIRIPVVANEYVRWELEIQDIDFPYVGTPPATEDRPYTIVDKYRWICIDFLTHKGRCLDPESDDPYLVMDETGIYLRFWNGLFPDVEYHFEFNGKLFPELRPSVWLSIERLQLSTTTSFQFYDHDGIRYFGDLGNILYNITNDLEVYPAWTFNFVSGMGQSGLTSFRLPSKNDTTFYRHFDFFHMVDDTAMDAEYVSIYIPFDSWKGPVDFHINVTFVRGYWEFENPAIPANKMSSQEWWVYGVENFLLVTTPWRLNYRGVGDPTYPNLWVRISCSDDITWLGYIQRGVDNEDYIIKGHPHFQMFYNQTWEDLLLGPLASRMIPAFIQVHVTDGLWASVTHLEHYQRFDFGWGRAYLYKGQTTLVMFLEDGTSYYGTGDDPFARDYCKVPSEWFDAPSWLQYLVCMISNLGGDLVGWLSSIFDRIWSALVGFGEWLHSSVMAFYGWLVSVVMNIVDVVGTILQSSLMILPFLIAIFVLAKGGRLIANIGGEKTNKEIVREALGKVGRAKGEVKKAWGRGKSWREATQKRLKRFRRKPR